MTTLQKFNDKDLLRNVRTNIINPIVDATNLNTLTNEQLKTSLRSAKNRLDVVEPLLSNSNTNLVALNMFAKGVAQQLSTAYERSSLDLNNKKITFTTFGGVEKTLDISPMFLNPVRSFIEVSDKETNTPFQVSKIVFKNATIQQSTENTVEVAQPSVKGSIEGVEEDINKIEILGNVNGSYVSGGVLKVFLPENADPTVIFVQPNPPQEGVNLFTGQTKEQAINLRDFFFNNNQEDLLTYDNNIFKVVILEWLEEGTVKIQFQCRFKNSWVNFFENIFNSYALSDRYLSELKDGVRVSNLELNSLFDINNIGEGVGVHSGKVGNSASLRKLKSESDLLNIFINPLNSGEISFKVSQDWKGFYPSLSEAESSIPYSERIANRTLIASLLDQVHTFYLWAGSSWEILDRGTIPYISESSVNFYEPIQKLEAGQNVTIEKKLSGENSYSHVIDIKSPIFAKTLGNDYERISGIDVSNPYSRVVDDVLILPSIAALDDGVGFIGNLGSIKNGDNISFTLENGVLEINAVNVARKKFIELDDTPKSYSPGKLIGYSISGEGLSAFDRVVNFKDLLDTPDSFSGGSLKAVTVNFEESGLEFTSLPNYDSDIEDLNNKHLIQSDSIDLINMSVSNIVDRVINLENRATSLESQTLNLSNTDSSHSNFLQNHETRISSCELKNNNQDDLINNLLYAVTRKKTEAVYTNLTLNIPTTTVNLVTLLKTLTPSSGSLTPFFDTANDKMVVFNENKSVFFKLVMTGSWTTGTGNRSLSLNFSAAVPETFSDIRYIGATSDSVSFVTFFSVDKNGFLATNGSTITVQSIGSNFTANTIKLVVEQ